MAGDLTCAVMVKEIMGDHGRSREITRDHGRWREVAGDLTCAVMVKEAMVVAASCSRPERKTRHSSTHLDKGVEGRGRSGEGRWMEGHGRLSSHQKPSEAIRNHRK